MTLAKFKKSLKFSSVIIFLTVYGLGFYLLGKNSSLVNVLKVQGAKTESKIQSPVQSPLPFADTQTATITASSVKLCANTVYAFEVSYPKDWFTSYNLEDQKCTFFAPYSFVVPQDTTNFIAPISIQVLNPQDFLGTVKYFQNPNDFRNVLSTQNVEIAGKSTEKIELTSTGQGSPRGFVQTVYLVYDDLKPMVISYQQTEEGEDIAKNKESLEEVVSTMKFF